MPVSQIVIEYINAVKWPALITGFGFYFRAPLRKIASRVGDSPKGSVTGPGGIGVSWDTTLQQVDAALEGRISAAPEGLVSLRDGASAPNVLQYPPPAMPEEREWVDIYELTKTMPGAAVLLSFTQVELALRDLIKQRGVDEGLNRMSVGMLLRREEIDPDLSGAIRQLSKLRNEVAHLNAKPSSQEAEEYMNSARRLTQILQAKP